MKIKDLFLISLVLKVLLAIFLPLSADEAYYWVWGQNLQLSYFDHPPVVAWLWSLGDWLFSFKSAARIPGVLLTHFSLWLWLSGLKNILTEKQRLYWLLIMLLCPLTGVGSVILTPDLPVLFFWSLAFYSLQNFLSEQKSHWAIVFGLSLGLGFSSKYHMVLFGMCGVLWLMASGEWRFFKLKNSLLILIFAIIGASPVFIWNYLNDFASFKFQLSHGLEGGKYKPAWTLSYILSQSLILYPTFLFLTLKNLWQDRKSLLLFLGLGPLVFFLLTSFKGLVETNWPIVAYAGFFALAISHIQKVDVIRRASIFFGFISVAVVGIAFSNYRHRSIEKLFDQEKYQYSFEISKKYSPVYASSYQMASFWWFLSKEPHYKLKGMGRKDFFDDLQKDYPKENEFYIVQDHFADVAQWLRNSAEIEKVESAGVFDVIRVRR